MAQCSQAPMLDLGADTDRGVRASKRRVEGWHVLVPRTCRRSVRSGAARAGRDSGRSASRGIFVGVAVALTAIEIYGVIAHSVTKHRRAIGIRTALSAQLSVVMRLVLGQCLALTVAALVIGIRGPAGVTRYLDGLLFRLIASPRSSVSALSRCDASARLTGSCCELQPPSE
jgi:hypothetical protein